MRRFLQVVSIALFYFLSASLYGQSPEPDYDEQAGALELPHQLEWCSEDGAYSTKRMKPGEDKISCAKDKDSQNDVWFKFQATSDQVKVTITPSGRDPISKIALGIYDAQSNELACAQSVADNLPTGLAYENLTVDTWYFIRVDNGKKKSGDFSVCLENDAKNDLRTGALQLPHGIEWCSADAAYSTIGMTPGVEQMSCAKEKESQNDVWFKFKASSEQIKLQISPSGENPIEKVAVAIYDDQNNEIACAQSVADDLPAYLASDALNQGEWYYVRVDNGKKKAGDFSICLKNDAGYDLQSSAMEIPHMEEWCSADGALTTIGMTPGTGQMTCAKEKESQNDVWLKFQATSELMELEVSPSGESPIEKFAVGLYDDKTTQIACAKSEKDNPSAKLVLENLEAGRWYFIRIDNEKKKAGEFSLCLKNELGYDFQKGAMELPHVSNWCSPENSLTTLFMAPGAEKISCAKDKESQNDVWFKFQATTEQVELKVFPSGVNPISKFVVGFYDEQFAEISCAKAEGGDPPVHIVREDLVPGQWYYARVDNGKDKAGEFSLCLMNELGYNYQAGALEIAHARDWCSEDGIYTTSGMTAEGEKISCAKDKDSQNDVWFKFQARTELIDIEVKPGGLNPISEISAAMYDANLLELVCSRYEEETSSVSLSHSGFAVGEWYYLRVDNGKDLSGDFSLCIKGGISVPETPTDLKLVVNTDYQGILTWSDNSNFDEGYIIERNVDKTGFVYLDSIPLANQTSYTDPVIIPGKDYAYRIIAFNKFGNSEYSNEDSVSVPNIIPYVPSGLTASFNTPGEVLLSWQDNSNNEDGFIIKYKTQFDSDYTTLDTTGIDETTFTHSIWHTGIEYSFLIASTNEVGTSEPATVATIAVPLDIAKEGNIPDLVEYNALKAIYESTDGANWVNNANWLIGSKSAELDAWHGIYVNSLDVKALSLGFNNLVGELPAELGDLTELYFIYMTQNAISSIPQEIGKLIQLEDIYLDDNNISALPVEIGRLSKLTVLQLTKNQFSSIPSEFGDLSELTHLYLSNNQVSGNIPTELGALENLEVLNLAKNQLEGSIPVEFGGLTKLTHLYLSRNKLTGEIPIALTGLAHLMDLYLDANQLDGTIPSGFGGLSELVLLYLNDNQLSGAIPIELGGLSNLMRLDLGSNKLTGEIPEELGDLSTLTSLSLLHNDLTGTIPKVLGTLIQLNHINLTGNELTGEIPWEFGKLNKLNILALSGNKLTGRIPADLGNLSNLISLSLGNNLLYGSIPKAFAGLTRLTYMNLNSNQLSGRIPAELVSLPENLRMNVNHNLFTFEDIIEAKSWFKGATLSYSQQDSVVTEEINTAVLEEAKSLEALVDRNTTPASKYQWYKFIENGDDIPLNPIPTETGHTYVIDAATSEDAGYYYYKITNDAAPDLTLYSKKMDLKVLGKRVATTSGAWADPATWGGADGIPSPGTVVRISGFSVTVDSDQECGDVFLDNSEPGTELKVTAGHLKVNGDIIIQNVDPDNNDCKFAVVGTGKITIKKINK